MFKAILDVLRTNRLMKAVHDDLGAMLDLASSHFGAAAAALLDGETMTFDVYAADCRINERVVSIRKRIVEHLTVNRPTDLVGELVFLTVINDVERVGDYAKTLVDTKQELGSALPPGGYTAALREQRDLLLSTFPDVRKALLDGDAVAGGEALSRLDRVRDLAEALVSALFDDTELSPAAAISLGLTARVFRRAAKHLRNAASAATSPFLLIGYTDSRDRVEDTD